MKKENGKNLKEFIEKEVNTPRKFRKFIEENLKGLYDIVDKRIFKEEKKEEIKESLKKCLIDDKELNKKYEEYLKI